MLVYVNSFLFEPEHGPDQIIQFVARWVGRRAKSAVDAQRLAVGIRELRLRDGSTLTSRATLLADNGRAYPFWFSARLSHPDDQTSGRRWTTEIGLYQKAVDEPVECSLLLKTDEVSARVTAPIQVTRPKLVEQLIRSCNPLGHTPGLKVKQLTQESAPAFLHEVERAERTYPIAILSAKPDSGYPVDPERLRSILVGLADVVCIPPIEDTFAIEDKVGRRFIAFGGAIKIVFPGRQGERGHFYENVRLDPEDISEFLADGRSVESEVLAAITHRTNLPFSWKHISPEKVAQAALRAQLTRTIHQSKTNEHSQQLGEYIALLEEADRELKAKDEELSSLQSDYQAKDDEARSLAADVAGLKHALSGIQSNDGESASLAEVIGPLRENVVAVLDGSPSLQQVVDLLSALYADRIVFLETSRSSAKESDRGGFRQGEKAFELLKKLATDYWQQLADGKGEQHAKSAFGHNAYSNNEGSALSVEGKRRRTFSYRGRDFVMEKHLKHGVKDSLAETLRVHFEWVAAEKKIIIGHCGKHLDF